jgi:hypothetical protein
MPLFRHSLKLDTSLLMSMKTSMLRFGSMPKFYFEDWSQEMVRLDSVDKREKIMV